MEAKYFNARWDNLLKWSTGIVIVILAVMVRGSFMPQFADSNGVIFIRTALLAMILGCFLLAPKCYVVYNQTLIIKRYAGQIVVPFSDIVSIRALDSGEMKFAIRTCGCGGFFGYYGWFWCRSLGTFKAYITDRANCVVIQTRTGRKIVISPDSKQEFMELLKAQI